MCLHTSVCNCVCVHICVLSGVRVSVCLYFTTNRGLRALRSMRTFSVPQVLTIQLERGSKHLGSQRDSQVSSVRPWTRRPAGVQKAVNSERLEGAVPRGLGRVARARAWEVRTYCQVPAESGWERQGGRTGQPGMVAREQMGRGWLVS